MDKQHLHAVNGFYRAAVADNQASVMAFFADDAIYERHYPGKRSESRTEGIAAISSRLAKIRAKWRVEHLHPVDVRCIGAEITAQVFARMLYRPTCNRLEYELRHMFRMNDQSLIMVLDEYPEGVALSRFLDENAATSTTREASWVNSVDQLLGRNVRKSLEARNMTREKVAEALGVSVEDVVAMEHGHQRIRAAQLFQLAQLLHVPLSSFYEGLGH